MAWLGFVVVGISALLHNDPNCMDDSGEEEEECQNQIDDDIHIARLLLEEHGEGRDENGEDDEKQLLIVQSHLDVQVIFYKNSKSFFLQVTTG